MLFSIDLAVFPSIRPISGKKCKFRPTTAPLQQPIQLCCWLCRELNKGIGRFRELLRVIESRSTQSLRQVTSLCTLLLAGLIIAPVCLSVSPSVSLCCACLQRENRTLQNWWMSSLSCGPLVRSQVKGEGCWPVMVRDRKCLVTWCKLQCVS